jgi:tRNA U38,U39,U40 pseudouridine synthase TruA
MMYDYGETEFWRSVFAMSFLSSSLVVAGSEWWCRTKGQTFLISPIRNFVALFSFQSVRYRFSTSSSSALASLETETAAIQHTPTISSSLRIPKN